MPIVGPLPFIFQNNTTADATQVNADFSYLADQINANAQPLSGPQPFAPAAIRGSIVATSDGGINIKAQSALLANGAQTANVVRFAIDVNMLITTLGAPNGLDTGVVTPSTWYYVYLIDNGTTTAGLMSLSSTAPVLPTGYIYVGRVGAVRTTADVSPNQKFLRTIQYGPFARYVVLGLATTTPRLPLMASGTVGSLTVPTWIAVGVGNFVPLTATIIFGSAVLNNNGLMAAPNNLYGKVDSTTNPPPLVIQNGGTGTQTNVPFEFMLETQNIYWASSAANNNLNAVGWIDPISVV